MHHLQLCLYVHISATLRECFPTRVLLGTINNPLTSSDQCYERDITDDGSGSIKACLCSTDYCNDSGDEVELVNEIFSDAEQFQQKPISSPSRNERTTTRRPSQRKAAIAAQEFFKQLKVNTMDTITTKYKPNIDLKKPPTLQPD